MNREATAEMFPATRWSLIALVQQGNAAAAKEALDHLLTVYYPVLLEFLQSRFRVDKSQAEEWLHSFVWKKELLRGLMHNARPARGRFRGLLAVSLVNFVRDELKRKRPQEVGLHLVKEEVCLAGQAHEVDGALDWAWSCRVLEETVERMRDYCQANGRQRVWLVFERRLLEPVLHGGEPVPYQELYKQAGFNNAVEAGNALLTAKRMFARTLREVIREYAGDEAEVEVEVQELLMALRKSS
ncbi:MAG: hypothetical protein N3J91_02465 [Verrucomicrobiae bacterium]|nr:hypothetical protein [Verrucomicrobiae bacterium]